MQNIRIEANVWHAQLYMWGLRLWKTFASSREDIYVSSHTNICQYVRVLVLASIAAVGYFFVTAYLGATFIYYPSVYFGWDYWSSLGTLVAWVAAAALAVVCLANIGGGMNSVMRWWRKKTPVAKKLEALMEGTPDRPSIVSVAKKYVEAHTEGFCAGIEIVAPAAVGLGTRNQNIGGFSVTVPVRVQEDRPSLVSIDYISSSRIEFLPVWWKLVLISLFSAAFLFIFNSVHESKQDVEAVWEGECSVGKWEKNSSSLLQLNLTCNGKEVQVTDTETLLSYINNSAKPRCFADKNNELYCKVSDKKRMKKKSE